MIRKTILLVSLSLLFCLVACTNENSQNNQATQTAQTDEHAGHDHAGHDHGAHVEDSALAPFIGLWEYKIAISISDKEAATRYKGQWADLKGNNTFQHGRWQQATGQGTWSYDEASKLMRLDYDDANTRDDEWRVQGGGDIMIWLGTKTNEQTGLQIKMQKITDKPTK